MSVRFIQPYGGYRAYISSRDVNMYRLCTAFPHIKATSDMEGTVGLTEAMFLTDPDSKTHSLAQAKQERVIR